MSFTKVKLSERPMRASSYERFSSLLAIQSEPRGRSSLMQSTHAMSSVEEPGMKKL